MKKAKKIIFIILLLGLILRVVGLNQSLWHDEAIGALEVKNSSFIEIVTDFARVDNHPPLYYLTLKAWSQSFGYSEVALRSLSVLFGIATIYVVYLLAKELQSKESFTLCALRFSLPEVVALLLTTSGLHIYYSQEARMYTMSAFFASLTIYCFIRLVNNKNRPWFLFSVALLVFLFTDYVNVFLLPVFWGYAIYKKLPKKWWQSFVLSHIPTVLVALLWMPVFLAQVKRGSLLLQNLPQWTSVAGGASLKHLALVWTKFVAGRISFYDKGVYYSLVILFSAPFLYLLFKSVKAWKKHLLYWLWLVLPLTLGFLASFVFPALIYFRFLFVLPAFYLLISVGLGKVRGVRMKNFILGLLVVINLFGYVVYISDEDQQREQWRQVVEFVENKADNQSDVVIFAYFQPPAGFRWYSNNKVQAFGIVDENQVQKALTDKGGVYYFDYLADLTDPNREVLTEIGNLGFSELDSFAFSGVGGVTYWAKDR